MKLRKKIIKKLLIIPALLSILLTFSYSFAQTLEIEVLGGGYKLKGPNELIFNEKTASLGETESTLNFSEISVTSVDIIENPEGIGSIIVIDENGGNEYSVTVSATLLTKSAGATPASSIPATNFRIRNYDDNYATFTIINGESDDFELSTLSNQDPDGFQSFSDGTITLANGFGKAPGRYRFFPKLKIVIPAGQRPGQYNASLTFTIA